MIPSFVSFLTQHQLFTKSDRILLAVSGGIDSVVMAELFHKAGYKFGIAHCNFSLRGKESDEDENFVRRISERYKVPFFLKKFETSEHSTSMGISVQMAARELRYQWFEEIRSSQLFDYIATAHHLDDQAETFLINLVRGTGISGLHGILPKQGVILRPLLFAFRNEITAYAGKNHLKYREDSSNLEDKYIRNKIRLRVIPLLEEINPEFRRTLTSGIKILRGWEETGRKEIDRTIAGLVKHEKDKIIIDLRALKTCRPVELYAWEILSPYGFNSSVIAGILDSMNRSSGSIFLSPGYRAVKDRAKLIIQQSLTRAGESGRMISADNKIINKPLKLRFSVLDNSRDATIPGGREFASLDLEKLTFPLELRRWRHGDSFHPYGMKGSKKLSDLLIDEKVSLPDKENTWVLCSAGKIAWVIGYRIDQRFRITQKTNHIYRIKAS